MVGLYNATLLILSSCLLWRAVHLTHCVLMHLFISIWTHIYFIPKVIIWHLYCFVSKNVLALDIKSLSVILTRLHSFSFLPPKVVLEEWGFSAVVHVPAWQARGREFNLWYQKKEKKSCSRIILYFPNLSPGTIHLSKCVSHFLLLLRQNTWHTQLTEEKFILASSFKGLSPWPVVGGHGVHAGRAWQRNIDQLLASEKLWKAGKARHSSACV